MTWETELHRLLETVPGAAERIARAFDESRIHGTDFGYWRNENSCGCAYGHAYENEHKAFDAAWATATANGTGLTPLERRLIYEPGDVRAAVVAWLAEHGTATEPMMKEARHDR